MLKIRNVILVLGVLMSPLAASASQVSIAIGTPNVRIGINLPAYPRLVPVPGYPVYYAPQINANYFFYDGMYWVYQDDDWYASTWYNGPWGRVDRMDVPVYVLRVPVSYYRRPPRYFHGWTPEAPPRWGDHWGREWLERRGDWDRWERPAPLPAYQGQYSGNRYPSQVQQQYQLNQQKYQYQPRDPEVRKYYDQWGKGQRPGPGQGPGQGQGKDKGHDRNY